MAGSAGPASLRLETPEPPCCSLGGRRSTRETQLQNSALKHLESFTGELPPRDLPLAPALLTGHLLKHHSGSASSEFSAPLTVVGLRLTSAYLIIIRVFR